MTLPVKIEAHSDLGPCLGFLYPSDLPQDDLVVKVRYMGQLVLISRVERAIVEQAIRARYGRMFG